MADPSADPNSFEALDVKHPDYALMQDDWDLYRDVLGEAAVDKRKYLPKAKQENPELYDFRVKLARFIPESPLAVDKLIAALFREKPKRELASEALEAFSDNVDLEGTHLNTYVQSIARQILGYGSLRLLINLRRPAPVGGRPLSRADELEQGVGPYLILYNPLSVIDWETDRYGTLLMVRIKEERWEKAPAPDHHVRVTRFVQYDRAHAEWWEFAALRGENKLRDHDKVEHGAGVVPMIVRHWRKLRDMVGASYMRYSAQADIRKFQIESDLAYDTYIHAHPILKARVRDDLKEIGIGSNSYIKLDPDGNEDVSYVDLPTSAFEPARWGIEEARTTIHRHAGMDPLGVVSAGTAPMQASGVARAWSFGMSEARILVALADIMEDVERQIFNVVLRLLGEGGPAADTAFEGEITYPEEFDLSATQDLLDQGQVIGQTINSPTLLRVLHKRIAASKVGDTGADILQQINDEIDKNPLIGTRAEGGEEPGAPGAEDMLAELRAAVGEEEPQGRPEEEPEEEEEPAARFRRRRGRGRRQAG